jgi:hypothetical protein
MPIANPDRRRQQTRAFALALAVGGSVVGCGSNRVANISGPNDVRSCTPMGEISVTSKQGTTLEAQIKSLRERASRRGATDIVDASRSDTNTLGGRMYNCSLYDPPPEQWAYEQGSGF